QCRDGLRYRVDALAGHHAAELQYGEFPRGHAEEAARMPSRQRAKLRRVEPARNDPNPTSIDAVEAAHVGKILGTLGYGDVGLIHGGLFHRKTRIGEAIGLSLMGT